MDIVKSETVALIINLIENRFGISFEKLKGNTNKYSYQRFLAFYLIREHTDFVLEKVGAIFNRHHTSVIYGIKNIEMFLDINDKKVSKDIIFLNNEIIKSKNPFNKFNIFLQLLENSFKKDNSINKKEWIDKYKKAY